MKSGTGRFFELTPAVLFTAGAYLLPLLLIAVYSVSAGGRMDLFTALNFRIIRFTAYQAFLSTLMTLAIGLPGAYLVGRTAFRFKGVFTALSTVPFVMPSVSMALGFVIFFGHNGILNSFLLWPLFRVRFDPLYTLLGIVMGNSFYNFPLVMIIVGGALSSLAPMYSEAARVDGASRLRSFLSIELPILLPSLATAALLSFVYCFTSFAVVLMIGGAQYSTLEVQIYAYLRTLLDFKGAAGLTVLQMFFVAGFAVIFAFLRKRAGIFSQEMAGGRQKFPPWGYLYIVGVAVMIFGPIISQIFAGFWNFQSSHFTFEWFARLFSGDMDAYIGNSVLSAIVWTVVFAASSAFLVVVLSVTASHALRRSKVPIGEALFTSALAVSPVTLAFGYVILQNYVNIPFPAAIIPIYTLLAFPLGFQTFLSGWERFPDYVDDAASVDGAGAFTKFFRIHIPILSPQLISTFLFSFAISIGEIGATLVLYDPRFPTISVSAYRLFSSRHVPEAQALSALLTISTFLIFYVLERPFFNEKR